MSETPRRSAPKKVVDLQPPSAAARFLPYAAAGAAVIALVVMVMKSPALGIYAAAALVALVVLGLGWVAWQHVIAFRPDDGARKAVAPATAAVTFAALALSGFTLFPPAPAGQVTLGAAGASGEVRVSGPAATVIVDAVGAFKPDVGTDAVARYALAVSLGRDEELIEGTFARSSSGSVPAVGSRGAVESSDATASRHVLQRLRGPGTYRVSLERVPESVRLPLRATVRAEPFSMVALFAAWGVLALLALVVDAHVARRNAESAYAAALGVVLASTLYLHAHFTPESVATDLFAAGLVGVFGGGIGGEIAARIARKIVG